MFHLQVSLLDRPQNKEQENALSLGVSMDEENGISQVPNLSGEIETKTPGIEWKAE